MHGILLQVVRARRTHRFNTFYGPPFWFELAAQVPLAELVRSAENELRTKISGNHIARDVRVWVSAQISGRESDRERGAESELPEGAGECISRERM